MSKPPFQPTHGRLLILRDTPVTKTEAGIEIASAAVKKPTRGQIVAAAPDLKCARLAEAALTGAFVHFPSFAGTDFVINGTTYLILLETEILGFET